MRPAAALAAERPAPFYLVADRTLVRAVRAGEAIRLDDEALRDKLNLAEADAVVAMMNAEQQKVIYLRIARRAAIDGLVSLSNYASQRADAIDGPAGPEEDPRVLLYTSLTNITTDTVEDIRDRISRIDRSRLSASDRKLLDAVLAVNTAITRDPVEEPDPLVIEADPPSEAHEGAPADDDSTRRPSQPTPGIHENEIEPRSEKLLWSRLFFKPELRQIPQASPADIGYGHGV